MGRERELATLRADIERAGLGTLSGRPSPHTRILLIASRPGSGRTALADEFAHRVADRYPDGVLRARLTDPGGAPVPTERTVRGLLSALGLPPPPAGADEDELTAAFRAHLTTRRVLLVLDDVLLPEQVLDLLPDSRRCLIVAVAPGPLTGVPDVRPCTPGGLDRASSVTLLRRHSGTSPRVTVDPRRAEELAQLCGDLPAALTLVGGWLAARPKHSLADAAARLRAVPTTDPLERAFRLVHDSLGAASRRTLRLLALAPARRVDARTASALTGGSADAAQAALEDYARLGLLREDGPHRYTVPGCLDPLLRDQLALQERPSEVMLARARMLERTVRRLGACHAVTEPEGSEARAWHDGLPRALRFSGADEAREWFEAWRPALAASARLAVSDGEGQLDTLARRLIASLARVFAVHLGPREAAPELYRLHELVLGVADRCGLPRERAATLLNLGDLDAAEERYPQALGRYREALDLSRDGAGDREVTGRALESVAGTYAELTDWDRAADWYGRALEFQHARGEPAAAARLHSRLGAVLIGAGRYGEALRSWKAAAAACRRMRDARAHARALAGIAAIHSRTGNHRDAFRACRQAVTAAGDTDDPDLRGALLLRLAEACEGIGEPAAAARHRAEAERLVPGAGASAVAGPAAPEGVPGGGAEQPGGADPAQAEPAPEKAATASAGAGPGAGRRGSTAHGAAPADETEDGGREPDGPSAPGTTSTS